MISRVPTRRRGVKLLIAVIFLVSFVASSAFARKEMTIATEGDPGDGNLSPELYSPAGSGGGTYLDGMSALEPQNLSWVPGSPVSLLLLPSIRFSGSTPGTVVWLPSHPGVSGFKGYWREWFPAGARRCGDVR